MRKTMEKMKEKKGITLIALVVTIAVILILAGITVGMVTSDNGVLKETKNAKTLAEIDNEKSIVERAKMLTMMRSKNGSITYEVFEPALKEEAGKMPTEVSDAVETIEVLFTDSNRYYEIDEDGNVSEPQEVVKDKNAGDITKGGRCDGSKEKPYEISCIEDLVAFSNMTNGTGIKFENGELVKLTKVNQFEGKYVTLIKNLNFKSKYSYDDSTRTDFGDLNENGTIEDIQTELTKTDENCIGFRTIAKSVGRPFKGIFNGNHKMIQNIYMKGSGTFYSIENSTIMNFGISGKINSTEYAGAIANNINLSRIENCYSKANIIALDGVSIGAGTGGIIGTMIESTIENCYNEGSIVGESQIGGIVGGCKTKSRVISCYNKGSINSNGTQVYKGTGGIVGGIYGDSVVIDGCYNNGNIGGTNCGSGGIVGEMYTAGVVKGEAKIINCYNNGKINNGNNNAGGIIGRIVLHSREDSLMTTIENCYNIHNINASGAGGIIGYIIRIYETATSKININNCYNIGEIRGNVIGELVGKTYRINQEDFKVSNSYYIEKRNNAVGQGNATETNVESKSQQYMKTNEFVELLNSNIDSTNTDWKKWKLGTNGYPTFID